MLRGAGLDVPVGATMVFAQALARVGLERRDGVYWAGRATLVKRPEDIDTYDRAFTAFWLGSFERGVSDVAARAGDPARVRRTTAGGRGRRSRATTDDAPVLSVRWSPTEVLRHADFAAYTPAEFAEARKLMADLRLVGRAQAVTTPPAEHEAARHARRAPHRAPRAAHGWRTGDAPLPRTRARSTGASCLLLDVSGSMEPYARAFVRFLHAAVVGPHQGRGVRAGNPPHAHHDGALVARPGRGGPRPPRERVTDWAGGTRLGEGLRTFNDTWGIRGMARGAVVVVLSDGWDRGEPEVLARADGPLARVALQGRVGQPAEGDARLRAAGAGNGGRAAVR